MTPGIYNFSDPPRKPFKRGDTFNGHQFEIFTVTPPSTTPVPVNFIGAVIKIQLRIKPGSPVVMEWLTSNSSITITGASNNIINMLTKTGLQMEIEPGKYRYDINVLLANGVTNTYVEGTMEIVDDISR